MVGLRSPLHWDGYLAGRSPNAILSDLCRRRQSYLPPTGIERKPLSGGPSLLAWIPEPKSRGGKWP